MRERAKEFLVALSLANLCFIRVWPDLLNALSAETYYLKHPPYLIDAGIVVLCVLLIATIFYVAVALARWTRRPLALTVTRWLFLGMLLIPLNGIRLQFPALHGSIPAGLFGPKAEIWIISLAGLLTAPLLFRARSVVVRVAKAILLILSPFVLYTFTQALWPPIRDVHANVIDETPAPRFPASERAKQRVVILLFDELDEDAIFSARPSTVKLPELDRFVQQAIHGTSVTSVAEETLKAMPALITGKQVSEAQPAAANELLITYSGAGQPVPWSRQANIFTIAREHRVNSALLGWYHPYCRIFGHVLNYCYWEPIKTRYRWEKKLIWRHMLKGLVETLPLASRFELRRRVEETFHMQLRHGSQIAQVFIPRYLRMAREAEKLVTDPSFGLILIHWPIPHPPAIYDRQTNDFRRHGGGSYLDNLQLVNRTLATLRASMEESGLWETTAVLITSDHPYRRAVWKPVWTQEEKAEMAPLEGKIGHRIPFLLKLPNQAVSLTFDRPLSNLIVPDLVVALLSSDALANPNSVIDWLSQHQKPATADS
jgi:hypothetical protein